MFHQPQSFITLPLNPNSPTLLGTHFHFPRARSTPLFALYIRTGDFSTLSFVLRPSICHRPMGTQLTSPLQTVLLWHCSRLEVLRHVVWHRRSNQHRTYTPWRLCECGRGSAFEISKHATQTVQLFASVQ